MLHYKNKKLHLDDCAISCIAETYGSPIYAYSSDAIRANASYFTKAFPSATICYACKANNNSYLLKIIKECGLGVDVVSRGELQKAHTIAEVPTDKIVFSGIGKTPEELRYAIELGILQINAESIEELIMINNISREMDKCPNIGIRINPHISAGAHYKISTAQKNSKFGVHPMSVQSILDMDLSNIKIRGLSFHIGSNISNITPFLDLFRIIMEIYQKHQFSTLDIGGGIGDMDDRDFAIYAQHSNTLAQRLGVHLILEPGRRIMQDAGILITKVIYTHKPLDIEFLVIDAGMNDMMRTAMYGAEHRLMPETISQKQMNNQKYRVVGPVCESSDYFGDIELLTAAQHGDIIVIRDVGAYGASMSSTYNMRPLIPEILVQNAQCKLIRKRQSYEQIWENELII